MSASNCVSIGLVRLVNKPFRSYGQAIAEALVTARSLHPSIRLQRLRFLDGLAAANVRWHLAGVSKTAVDNVPDLGA